MSEGRFKHRRFQPSRAEAVGGIVALGDDGRPDAEQTRRLRQLVAMLSGEQTGPGSRFRRRSRQERPFEL